MTASFRSPSRPGAWGLAVVAAGIVTSILPAFLLGSLSIEIRAELGYQEATAGLIFATFFAASAVVSSRIGTTIDRVGSRVGMLVALGGVAGVQILIAGVARAPWVLAVLAGAGGIANATAQLSANVFIARQLPVNRQGIGFAVKQSAMPGASLVAGLALPSVALTLGWRWVFVLGGVLAVLALGGVIAFLPHPPPADAEPAPGSGGVRPADGVLTARGRPAVDRPRVAPTSSLYTLAVAAALSTAAAITLGGFFVESTIDAGVSAAAAGIAFAVGSLISIVVRLTVGALADRRQGNLLGVVAGMLALGAMSSIIFTVRIPWVQFLGVPIAFGLGWAWPGLFNLSVVRASPGAPGKATGITQTGTYIGGAIGPVLFGWVAQHGSYSAAWWLAAGLGLGAAAAVLAGRRMLRSNDRRPSSTRP